MVEQDIRVIQVQASTPNAINEALRQLCMMIYRLEGRIGPTALRDSLSLSSFNNQLFGAAYDNTGVEATYTVSAEVDGQTVNRVYLARGAVFGPPATVGSPAGGQWTATSSTASIVSLHESGQTLYYNSGLTVGLQFSPTVSYVFPVPGAKISRSTNQSITDTTDTALVFDVENFDGTNMADLAAHPERITVAIPGRYLVGGNILWANSAVGRRILYVSKNGSTSTFLALQESAVSTATRQVVVTLDSAVAGDYYELHVIQTSGGPLDVTTGAIALPNLWAQYQGP